MGVHSVLALPLIVEDRHIVTSGAVAGQLCESAINLRARPRGSSSTPRIPAAERRLGNVGVRDTGDEEADPRRLRTDVDPRVGRTVLHQSVACG
jgi:hypothetical protein